MLQELSIRNFALIDQIDIRWKPGLNVLTGETGAGKSIIIDALNLVLGGKANPGVIRGGADRAIIEASFLSSAQVRRWLKSRELQCEDDPEVLVISREISKTGSRCRVNGTLVNLNQLLDLRQQLLTIYAQHEARSLLLPQAQLDLIDGLGDTAHQALLQEVHALYEQQKTLLKELQEVSASEEDRARKLDFTQFQFKELQEAYLQDPGEFEEVSARRKKLSSVAQLEEAALAAQSLLAGADGSGNPCALDHIQAARAALENVSQCDDQMGQWSADLNEHAEALGNISRSLRKYRETLDTNPQALADLEARLNLLASIKRKYGPSLSDAINRREHLQLEVARLSDSQTTARALEDQLKSAEREFETKAGKLSQVRKKLCEHLAASIKKDLRKLGMEHCNFEIAVEEIGPNVNGKDKAEMLISPNPGQPLLPVSKIASGGELSRVMLAIKTICAQADRVATVVFDEVDTGLSGKTLQSVRDKLAQLSQSHQILCITHQPMIASVADNHLLIIKNTSFNTTTITVKELKAGERIKSIAGMASGYDDQKEAVNFAKALFSEAADLRQSFGRSR